MVVLNVLAIAKSVGKQSLPAKNNSLFTGLNKNISSLKNTKRSDKSFILNIFNAIGLQLKVGKYFLFMKSSCFTTLNFLQFKFNHFG